MGNSITFIPVRREGADPHTLAGSLAKNGMARLPGCRAIYCPLPEIDGTIRTGLDPDALYIQKMDEGPEKDAEIERVTKLRKDLEKRTGLKLGPRDPYFANFGRGEGLNDTTVGQWVSMPDEPITLDFTDPINAITAAWLTVDRRVAKSKSHFRDNPLPTYEYYIKDEEAENKVNYEDNKAINRSVVKLDEMTPVDLRKYGQLLDLPINDNTPEENAYNLISFWLRERVVKQGSYKGRRPVHVFNEVLSMSDSIQNVKLLIKQAIRHDIYRKTRGQIFEGEVAISNSEEELTADLIKDTNSRMALEKKVKGKKVVNNDK